MKIRILALCAMLLTGCGKEFSTAPPKVSQSAILSACNEYYGGFQYTKESVAVFCDCLYPQGNHMLVCEDLLIGGQY